MSEEKAIEIINKIRDSITDNENIYLLCDSLEDIIKNNKQSYDIQLIVSSLLNYIDELQKEIKNADERNYSLGLDFIQIGEKLGLESFGRLTILLEIDKLQKENNIKDKVIDNLYADIEYEYSGTNYLKSLDEYYEEVQDE